MFIPGVKLIERSRKAQATQLIKLDKLKADVRGNAEKLGMFAYTFGYKTVIVLFYVSLVFPVGQE